MGKKDKDKYNGTFFMDTVSEIEQEEKILKDAAEKKAEEVKKVVHAVRNFAIALAVFIIFLMSSVVTPEDRYSIIMQFGNIVRVEDGAGISFKIPAIQNIKSVEKQMLFYDIAPSDVITSDKKTMIADAYVLWRVTDPDKYYRSLSASRINAEGRLNAIVYNALKNTISNMTQNEVILSRDGKIVVTDIAVEDITNDIIVDDDETDNVVRVKSLTDKIKENLEDTSGYGIEIVKTEVKILDLPESNKNAVYERMTSERENVAASYTAQGKSDAQMITNTTDREIAIMQAEAEAEAASVIAEGEAEYMRILSEAYNDPQKEEFYSFVRSLDAAKASLAGSNNILMLDGDSPLAQIFYDK